MVTRRRIERLTFAGWKRIEEIIVLPRPPGARPPGVELRPIEWIPIPGPVPRPVARPGRPA